MMEIGNLIKCMDKENLQQLMESAEKAFGKRENKYSY